MNTPAVAQAPGSAPVGMLDWALRYARTGIPVLPLHWPVTRDAVVWCSCGRRWGRGPGECKSAGKHPRTAHGVKDATTDEGQVRAWWSQWPSANVGIATGERAGFLVLDVDAGKGGLEALAAHGPMPVTPTARTGSTDNGRGLHYCLALPPGLEVINSTERLGAGLDVKTTGGFVVAAPSRHPSGVRYAWEEGRSPWDVAVAPAPAWLVEALRAPAATVEHATGTAPREPVRLAVAAPAPLVDGRPWTEQVNAQGVAVVGKAFGLEVVKGHGKHQALSPCPSCSAQTRSRSEVAGAVGLRGDDQGWRCFKCDASGDAVALAAWCVTGRADAGGEWARVRGECANHGLCSAADPPGVKLHKRSEPAQERPPSYPPRDEVTELWRACVPVTADDVVSAWLRDVRGIDLVMVEALNLARALPAGAKLPRWAGFWLRDGYRLVVPLYDAAGRMMSLRARRVFQPGSEPDDKRPKGVAPYGYDVRGLVMAEGRARGMLCAGPAEAATSMLCARDGVVVSEGEPDFLAQSTFRGATDPHAPAVVGVTAGSWTADLAARVPHKTRVVVRTDNDKDGDKYASAIVAALHPRQCPVFRAQREDQE